MPGLLSRPLRIQLLHYAASSVSVLGMFRVPCVWPRAYKTKKKLSVAWPSVIPIRLSGVLKSLNYSFCFCSSRGTLTCMRLKKWQSFELEVGRNEGLVKLCKLISARAKQIRIVALPTRFDLGIGITFLLYFRSVTHFRRLLFPILPSYSIPTYNIWIIVKLILNADFEYAMGKQVRMKRS